MVPMHRRKRRRRLSRVARGPLWPRIPRHHSDPLMTESVQATPGRHADGRGLKRAPGGRRHLVSALVLAAGLSLAGPSHAEEPKPSLTSKSAQYNLVGHGGPVKVVRLDQKTKRILTGSFDYAMMLWDVSVTPPVILQRFEDHEGAVNAAAFLPDGKRGLSAGDDGAVWLWDLATGKLLHRFNGHTAKILALVVSPDGRMAASASWDRTVRLWDLEGRKAGPVLKGHRGPVNAVTFSQDNTRIFTAGYDGTVRSWSRKTGEFQRLLYKHGWGLNVLRRVPAQDKLIFGSLNGAVGVLDTDSGDVVKTLTSHEGPVLSLDVIEKPGLVATGGGDGNIHVWRTGDWAKIETHRNPYGPVWALSFAAQGARIYYGGLDDFVTMWQVTPREPFETVQSKYPRRFQVSETVSLGERQFARKCSVCHTLKPDGRNRAGPTLHKLFGRRAGSLPGYPYSNALKSAKIVWNEETIAALFDIGPEHYTPGTKMPLQRIADKAKRDALVAFLKAATDGPEAENENKTNKKE